MRVRLQLRCRFGHLRVGSQVDLIRRESAGLGLSLLCQLLQQIPTALHELSGSWLEVLGSSILSVSKYNVCIPSTMYLKFLITCLVFQFSSVQSLSHVQLCDPMDCSTPGFPVHHQLLELLATVFCQVS